MGSDLLETRAHTNSDGKLHLDLNVGVADADVTVIVRVMPPAAWDVDANGWPVGYFERISGSMPELERAPQGDFEERSRLE